MTDAEKEVLKLVKSGFYSIDSLGRIWRHRAFHTRNGKQIEVELRRAEHETGQGYLCIHVKIGKKLKKAMAHRIVWIYFNGDIGNLEINHIDGNKKNNDPKNIERATRSENMRHAFASGFVKVFYGEGHPNHKLTKVEAERIKSILRSKLLTKVELSRMFNVNPSTIAKIEKGITWK